MLDFGFAELFIIVCLALLVIAPKDIPKLMHGLGQALRRLQYMRSALTMQFENFMEAAEQKNEVPLSENDPEKSEDEDMYETR